MKDIQPIVLQQLEELHDFWKSQPLLRQNQTGENGLKPGRPLRSVATIGNFDGLHLGHRQLIQKVVAEARELQGPAIVMTFDPHPVQVLFPERKLTRLFSREDQVQVLGELGVDVLLRLPFSREFSQLSGDAFVETILIPYLRPAKLIVGHDFSFGSNKSGTLQTLALIGTKLGMEVDVVPAVTLDASEIVSSSRIRKALEQSEVVKASRMLGRYFYVQGWVERGAGRGRTIGVPTANIRMSTETLPQSGVYAVKVKQVTSVKEQKRELQIQTSQKKETPTWEAVANIGRNPTFTDGSHPLSLEVHILDFSGDLYGVELQVEFLEYLRGEMKFSSSHELVKQIQQDIVTARKIHAASRKGSFHAGDLE